MGSVAIGAIAALIGVLSGAKLTAVLKLGKLDERLLQIEDAVPELITRAEVQDAFQQVAQVEAQRMQQQQQQAAMQARQQAVFSERTPDSGAMNKQINDQLAVLSARMKQINDQFGLEDG
ncbi:MAG TPA: hypothetical protein DEP13_04655 [Gammaproteobacteria bacterium]|nr:MAG: hypothetical protein CBD74_01895 [Saprospirales bacterium TMED214]HCA35916.1 hypothetical protein [Gammaproteobacteria bacterium]